jgi:hypothetical protein
MRITACSGWKVSKKQAVILFLLFTSLLLVDRTFLIHRFLSNYIESDQAIFWYAADEAIHGRFHEPCFFGQSYNSNLEPYLAVPLIYAGIPHRYALPIITQCLALAPFFIFSVLLFRERNYACSLFILSLPLLFPVDYIIISSLPRGFVTGIFFVALGLAFFLRIKKDHRFAFLLFFTCCGLILNPNCLLLALPLLITLLAGKLREPGPVLFAGTGVLSASLLFCLSKLYYVYHPLHDFYRIPVPTFSFNRFFSAFDHLDEFLFGNAVLILGILLLLTILLYRLPGKIYFMASFVTLVVLIASFGFDRINGSFLHNPVFLSKGRMFLAVPLLIGLQFSWATKTRQLLSRKFSTLFIYGLMMFSFFNVTRHLSQMRKTIDDSVNGAMSCWVRPVDSLRSEARVMARLAKEYKATLFVFDWYNEALVYSGPLMADHTFETLFTLFDRRTWLLEEEEKRSRNGFFLYDPRIEHLEKMKELYPRIVCVKENYPCIYFVPGACNVLEVLRKAEFPIRAF